MSVTSETNGTVPHSKAESATKRANSIRKSRATVDIYSVVEAVVLRPVPTISFIIRCCWNIFVSLIIVSFVTLVAVYRLFFVIGMNTMALIKALSKTNQIRRNRRFRR